MKTINIRTIIALFLLMTFSIIGNAQTEEEKATIIKIGQQVPQFSFTDANGQQKSIADLKGQVVLINFFATWCGPCLKELPHVQNEIFVPYRDNSDFTLLVIGREHSAAELKTFKETKGKNLEFELIADPERKIYSKFAQQFIPRNFLIDREGKIIYSSIGFQQEEFQKLKDTLETLLKEK